MSLLCLNYHKGKDTENRNPKFYPDEKDRRISLLNSIWDIIQAIFIWVFALCFVAGWIYVIYLGIKWLIKIF